MSQTAASTSRGPIRVVVATTVFLSFISFWRAAAIVLADLGSSAFYAGGIAEQAVGRAAPWFILGVMLFSYAVRAIYIESSIMFVRGGVYRVVKEAMGGHAGEDVGVGAAVRLRPHRAHQRDVCRAVHRRSPQRPVAAEPGRRSTSRPTRRRPRSRRSSSSTSGGGTPQGLQRVEQRRAPDHPGHDGDGGAPARRGRPSPCSSGAATCRRRRRFPTSPSPTTRSAG